MNHKNDIPYPTAEQKKRAVAQIVRQTKPPRVGAIRFLFNAYREIGMATVLRNSIGTQFHRHFRTVGGGLRGGNRAGADRI